MVGRDRRRGGALLVVLVALASASVVMATIAERSGRSALSRRDAAREEALDRLLLEAERCALVWLESESASTVLDPNTVAPGVHLLEWSGEDLGMRLTAFDQCGMVPLDAALSGSALRLALPSAVLRAVDQLPELDTDARWGLDDLPASPIGQFPDTASPSAVGALVATHPGALTTINVATAPRRLLEVAFQQAALGSLSDVLDARAKGEVPPAAGSVAGPAGDEFIFTTASDSWAFRIDVSSGALHRSWWSVFRGSGTSWSLTQRLLIDE